MKRKHLVDGEWYRVPAKGHQNACCDCGLVHDIEYRLAEDGAFEVRFAQNKRATGSERRKMRKAAKHG